MPHRGWRLLWLDLEAFEARWRADGREGELVQPCIPEGGQAVKEGTWNVLQLWWLDSLPPEQKVRVTQLSADLLDALLQ